MKRAFRGGGFGSAEDGAATKYCPVLARSRQTLGERDADRAHRDVNAPMQAGDHAGLTKTKAFDGGVIGEHRHHGVAPTGVRHRRGGASALRNERLRFVRRAVVDGHVVTCL